jgi:polyhydroxybutyrate depolymerase
VPIVAFHGTADPVDPYDGNGQAYWTYSVPTAASRWAAQDGCARDARPDHHSGFTLTTYQGCAGNAVVELYSVTGEGHEWPGGPQMPSSITTLLGPQSNAVDADTVIWAFFSQHPMPPSR